MTAGWYCRRCCDCRRGRLRPPTQHPRGNTSSAADRVVTVTGVVQGVGFRPFVHRLARELGLDGFVGNDSARRVRRGRRAARARSTSFARRLRRRRAAARPCRARSSGRARRRARRSSPGSGSSRAETVGGRRARSSRPTPPSCDDCLAELFDPADRRYRYPFITCTNCGPRFTIIRDLPYDRPATTMAGFPMCPACAAEYDDPADRRYHAQPIACPDCGPTLVFAAAATATRRPSDRPRSPARSDALAAGADRRGQGHRRLPPRLRRRRAATPSPGCATASTGPTSRSP